MRSQFWRKVVVQVLASRSVVLISTGGIILSTYIYFNPQTRDYRWSKLSGMSLAPYVQAASKKTRIESLDPDSPAFLSTLATRERRFVQFSSVDYNGQLYMTPRDFLDSVTGREPRHRYGRRLITDDDVTHLLNCTPKLHQGSKNFFRDLNDAGLISYTEYLFFLSILTKPRSGFQIAFNMFDTDANANVSKDEFLVVMKIFAGSVKKNVKQYLADGKAEILERIFSSAYQDRAPSASISESALGRTNTMDTTLLVHLFGKMGKSELTYDQFCKFMEDLQLEVLELEFYEFSRGMNIITEEGFAKILLRYTHLRPNEYDDFLERLAKREKYDMGITFTDFKEFFQFLNNLDDFAIAMRMYTLADKAISKSEFVRAVKICTGAVLAPHVVDTVFALFDVDGDGALSYKEFIAIMRDRLHRGVKSSMKAEGWEAFKHCLKQEMRSVL
ncbi:calcium uptake protein 3, mitochondrial-like [Artemia franciscana]